MKELNIKNEKKLYKKIFLYKTILYKNVKFNLQSSNEETNCIIEALNIKNRLKRLEYINNFCCNTIDEYYKGKNICGFKGNKCIIQQQPNCEYYNGCCRLCKHQSPNGCKTSNLSCKFFFCTTIMENNKILKYNDFKILKLLSFRQKLILKSDYFSTKEELIKDLYYDSMIIYAIRLSIRMIRDFVLFRIKNKIKSN